MAFSGRPPRSAGLLPGAAPLVFPDPETARRLTTPSRSSGHIAWTRTRRSSRARLCGSSRPAARLRRTAPLAIHNFNQITGGNVLFPGKPPSPTTLVFTGKQIDDRQTSIGRAFGTATHRKAYYPTRETGSSTSTFPSRADLPGMFVPGADSHSRAYGPRCDGLRRRLGDSGFGWATGYVYSRSRRPDVWSSAAACSLVSAGLVLELLRRWGPKQSSGMSVESGLREAAPIAYRNTIAHMMAEGEALNGIFAQTRSRRPGTTRRDSRCRTRVWSRDPRPATRSTRSSRFRPSRR